MKPYKVIVTQTVVREYETDARSPEDAEAIVVNWIEDGEPGVVMDSSIETVEAFENDNNIAL